MRIGSWDPMPFEDEGERRAGHHITRYSVRLLEGQQAVKACPGCEARLLLVHNFTIGLQRHCSFLGVLAGQGGQGRVQSAGGVPQTQPLGAPTLQWAPGVGIVMGWGM